MSQLVPESWSPSINVSGKSESVRFYGASLVFEEKIALRMYFSVSDGEHTFRWNGQELTSVQAGEYRYVEIRDINPQDLDEIFTVSVDENISVSYSPMHYIVRMYQKGSEQTRALMQALYHYYLAAENLI